MRCNKCGNEVADDMIYCNKCGIKIVRNEEPKEATNQNIGENSKNTSEINQQPNNSEGVGTITSQILLYIIVTVAFYFGFMVFWYLVNGEFYIPVFLKIVIIGAGIFYGLKYVVDNYTNGRYKKPSNMSSEILKLIVGIIIIIVISIGINNWMQGVNEQKQSEQDKILMLESIQKYSTSMMTVNDFDVDLIEKTNTYTIYKVNVSKRDYLIDGDFYIALLMPSGNGMAEYTIINQDLSRLRQQINN